MSTDSTQGTISYRGHLGGRVDVDQDLTITLKPSVGRKHQFPGSRVWAVHVREAKALVNGEVQITYIDPDGVVVTTNPGVIFRKGKAGAEITTAIRWLTELAEHNKQHEPGPAVIRDQRNAKDAAPVCEAQVAAVTPTWPFDTGRPSWMIDPLLTSDLTGRHDLEVVGESHYQEDLWRLVGGLTQERVRRPTVAVLVPEDGNPFDSEAVGVWVAGFLVGYLKRVDASDLRPGIIELVRSTGRPVSMQGVIVGGGDRPDGLGLLGVWLYYNPSDFGLKSRPAGAIGDEYRHLRTGTTEAVATDLADDSYDMSWMFSLPDAGQRRIEALRGLLESETQPISRHYLFHELETELYDLRDVLPNALEEYDAVASKHHCEMTESIRPALLQKFGALPLLATYRQASIRHAKGGADLDRALWWAQCGLEIYGQDAYKDEWRLDLVKRSARIQARIEKRNADRSRQAAA